jgi:hypothetical protein
MDFRDILKSFDNLSEATTTTDKGKVHTAEPGGYGYGDGSEEVKDQYGNRVGRASLSKMGDKPAVKRGKGRPPKNADSSGEVKSYDSSELSKAMGMGKAPKPTGKPSVKHSLKEYLDQLDKVLNEADAYTTAPMPGAVAVKDASGKVVATAKNPQAAAAFQKGDITLGGDEQGVAEGELDEMYGPYDDDKVDAINAANPPKAPSGQPNRMTPKPATQVASAPRQANTLDHDAWDKFTGRDKVTEKDVGKPNNATTGFEALVRKLTPKYGKEAATKIAGSQFQKQKMNEVEAPTIDNMTAMGANLGAGRNPNAFESKKGVNPFAKKDTKKKPDADKDGIPDYAEDGKGKNDTKKKGAAPKKGVNPFAKKDDKDEKKGAAPKKGVNPFAKKKVKEGMEQHLKAAWHQGRAHGLTGQSHNGKHYEDMEEANMYHRGYKHGLDECYGQPIVGLVREADPIPATVPGMASAAEPSVDEGTAFTAALARTPNGGQFNVGGKTFTDRSGYDAKLDEFAFESWDNQLNAILNEDAVSEGLSVSISKGQQNSPDSVSVTAQDGEADQLLGLLKQAGLGLFGGEAGSGDESSTMMMPSIQGSEQPEGEIEVVDDHDNMLSLIRKMTGQGPAEQNGDYADEEGHSHEEGHGEEGHSHEEGEEDSCNECGMAYESCECDDKEPVVDENQSYGQEEYGVAENAPDSGADNTNADVAGNAAANNALAKVDAGQDEEEGEEDAAAGEDQVDESILEEWANEAGKNGTETTFEQDIDFMTKVISGGLNGQKSTGQTTIPVVAAQRDRMGSAGLGNPMKESTDLLKDFMKLSGL